MASIGAIGATSPDRAASSPMSNGAAHRAAEHVLGMTGSALRVELGRGRSLMDIAAGRGMDRAAFITKLADTINRDRPELGPQMADALASRAAGAPVPPAAETAADVESRTPGRPEGTEMPSSARDVVTTMPATAIAQSVEVRRGDVDSEGAKAASQPASGLAAATRGEHRGSLLDNLSHLLGASRADLAATFARGASPASVAAARGVSVAEVASALEHALRQSGSSRVASGAKDIAGELVSSPLRPGMLLSLRA